MRQGETDPIWKKRLRQKPRSEKAARIQKLLKQFDVSQWWDPDDIATKQFQQIAGLLDHAQSSIPHYAGVMGDVNPYDIN